MFTGVCGHHPGKDPAAALRALLWGSFGEVGLGSRVQEGQLSFSVHGVVQQNNASLDFRIS